MASCCIKKLHEVYHVFSGIIDHCGIILALEKQASALQAVISCEFSELVSGESIAVDGICLTVINPQKKQFTCDISIETLNLTTAKTFAVGRKVNLERALCLGDRVGGHMVSGHVDQCAMVQSVEHENGFARMQIGNLAVAQMPYLVKKGSVAVNGVSLTINHVTADGFELMLIPHTLENTNLQYLNVGDTVNLEFDTIVKTIINYLQQIPLKQLSL